MTRLRKSDSRFVFASRPMLAYRNFPNVCNRFFTTSKRTVRKEKSNYWWNLTSFRQSDTTSSPVQSQSNRAVDYSGSAAESRYNQDSAATVRLSLSRISQLEWVSIRQSCSSATVLKKSSRINSNRKWISLYWPRPNHCKMCRRGLSRLHRLKALWRKLQLTWAQHLTIRVPCKTSHRLTS